MDKKEHVNSNKNKGFKKTNKINETSKTSNAKENHKKAINNLDLDIEALKQKISLITNIEGQEQEKEDEEFKEAVNITRHSPSHEFSQVPSSPRITSPHIVRQRENLEQQLTSLQVNSNKSEALAKEQEQQIRYSSFNPSYNESTEEIFRRYEAGTSRPTVVVPTLRQREVVQTPSGVALTRTEMLNPLRSRGIQSMSTERDKIEAEMRQTQVESITEKEFREKYKRVKF